jgi:hypothetical protein
MATQKFMGRNELVPRLAAQVGSEALAKKILIGRGQMDLAGRLTPKGEERNAMTAKERALDRAHKKTGRIEGAFHYDPQTNRATLGKKHG